MKKLFLILLFGLFFLIPHQTSEAQIYTTDKLITVDIGSQMLYAWNGGQIVHQTRVSTGMRYTPTVKGTFSILRKVPLQDMRGNFPPYEPYYIKDVPHVMYFYGAYAIHGTHWHNSFGTRVSHGCVNVPLASAEWLYNFADVGTKVLVF